MALLKYWDGTKYVEFGTKSVEEVAVRADEPPEHPDLWLDTDAVPFSNTEADALYLKASGGAMAGPLTLAVDPVQPSEAATKQYTDGLVTVSESAPPATPPRDGVLWVYAPPLTPTTTALSAQPTSVALGGAVTLTAAVTADAGKVQFKKDGAAIGSPVSMDAAGVATTADIPQAEGTVTYTAEYLGIDSWGPSASTPVTVTVTRPAYYGPGPNPAWGLNPIPAGEQRIDIITNVVNENNDLAYFYVTTTGGGQVHVDWGDGSSSDYNSGTRVRKQYAAPGLYKASITPAVPPETLNIFQFKQPTFPDYSSIVAAWAGPQMSQFGMHANDETNMLEFLAASVPVKLTACTQAYQFCMRLLTLPAMDTSAAAAFNAMFDNCRLLEAVPAIDMSLATTTSSMFTFCGSLASIEAFGCTVSVDLSDTVMGADALNTFFTNLGTAAGAQIVNITGTPGAATCDRTIATAKGWTVTG